MKRSYPTHLAIGILLILALPHTSIFAQQNVGINTTTPDTSAALDIVSTNKGLLIPRMDSTARKAIGNPAVGLMVFDLTTDSYWYHGADGWKEVGTAPESDPKVGILDTNYIPKWNGSELVNSLSVIEDNSGLVIINNGLQIGTPNAPTPDPGTIRWNPATQDFEGFTGTRWKSLTTPETFPGDFSQKITASDAQADDLFGFSVAISGDYAIVGAFEEDAGGSNAGAAYFFFRDGTNWTQQAKITASDAQPGDYFGYRVAISGDYAIVGAYQEDAGGSNAGAAYFFIK